MNHVLKATLVVFCIACAALIHAAPSSDNFPVSDNAPGGLTPAQCPQFICFGFDDNGFYDGVNWIADSLCKRTNPHGNGNPATYDGTPLRFSFFIVGSYGNAYDTLFEYEPDSDLAAWMRVYTMGNELGNHTYTHDQDALGAATTARWTWEVQKCDSVLVNMVGEPKSSINGFRTPALLYSTNTMDAVYADNKLYDCSVEEYRDYYSNPTDTPAPYHWPYTLDNGTWGYSLGRSLPGGTYKGMWEFPVQDFALPNWQSVTGLDYNIWCTECNTGGKDTQTFLQYLEATLTVHLHSNRSPMLIGMHSDWYSQFNADANTHANPEATWQARRTAVIQFIDWALAQDPGVRIVPMIDVINWMRHPTALGAAVAASPAAAAKSAISFSASFRGSSLAIGSPSASDAHLWLYDARGRLVADLGRVSLAKGRNILSVKQDLPFGSYVLRVSGPLDAVLVLNHI
jgi:peptidoglycan/xylan/chitin deacetylase (PgdA/CDA1 family)